MFKYEMEIDNFNQRYVGYIFAFRNIPDALPAEDAVPRRFSGSTFQAVQKYYTFVKGEGYVRKESEDKLYDRRGRDLFEKNNIDYPHKDGLYLLGQTFFNPITDEKFYWIKPGTASDLKRRRRDYSTHTAMIWDIDYYTGNELTESGCHRKLKEIALHRHADEWFSVSREDYLAICEQGFNWFKEA